MLDKKRFFLFNIYVKNRAFNCSFNFKKIKQTYEKLRKFVKV